MNSTPDAGGSTAPRRSILLTSFGLSAAVFAALLCALVLSGATAEAATYNLTSTAPAFNWNDPLRWNGGTGTTWPGQNATSDVANVTLSGSYTLSIPVALNPMTINVNCGACVVSIDSGGVVTLQSVSNVASGQFRLNGGTLAINAGNQLDIQSGASFVLNSGTFDNNGTVNVQSGGAYNFNGGTISGAGDTNVGNGASFTFNGANGVMTMDDQDIVSSGSLTFLSTANDLHMNNGASILTVAGSFSFGGSANIQSSGGGTIQLSGAAMSKTGAGTQEIYASVINSAGVVASSGVLRLRGGGTHNGAINTASTGSIELYGSHQLNAGASIIGLTATKLLGGTLSLNSATPSIPANVFEQGGGTITGSGILDVTTFTWTAGSMSGGNGRVRVGSTATLNFNSAATLSNYFLDITSGATVTYAAGVNPLTVTTGGVIDQLGTFNYNAGAASELILSFGGELRNQSSGLFTFSADQAIQGTGGLITNAGTMRKNVGSGNSNIFATLMNSGTLAILSTGGTPAFTLKNGGTHTGVFNAASPGAYFDFNGGTHNLNAGTSLTGAGGMKLTGGTLAVNTALTFLPFFMSGGFLTGNANVTLGAFTWAGGSMSGGLGSTILSGNSSFTGVTAALEINNRDVVNNGTLNYVAVNFLQLNNGGGLKNNTTLNITADGQILSDGLGGSILTNVGTMSKTAGGGQFQLGAFLINSGTINVNSGTFRLTGGGTNTGTINLPAIANVFSIAASSFVLNAGTNLPVANAGVVAIDGGTLTVNTATSLTNLDLNSGALNVAATITVSTLMKWKGGTVNGGGNLVLAGSGQFDASTNALSVNGTGTTITNNGSVDYFGTATNFLTIASGASVVNGVNGNWDILADTTLAGVSGGTFTNNGSFNKGLTGGIANVTALFNSNGGSSNVNVSTGTLRFSGTGTIASPVTNAGTLEINSNVNLNAPATYAGAGTLSLIGGTLALNVPATVQTFNVSGGNLSGGGNLTIHGGTWSAGTIGGAGTLTLPATFTFTLTTTGVKSLDRAFSNSGTVLYQVASGVMNVGSAITNAGIIDFQGDGTLSGLGSIANSGTIKKTAGTAGTGLVLSLPLTNDGTIQNSSGALHFLGGGTHNGTFTNDAGKTMTFQSVANTFNAPSTINNAGQLAFSANALINGTYNAIGSANTGISGGTTTLNTNASLPFLSITGGSTLAGSGNVAVSTNAAFQNATVTGAGTLTFAAGANVSAPSGTFTVDGRPVTNNGSFAFSSTSPMAIVNGASFTNGSGATFTITTDAAINAIGSATFANAGTFTKQTATGNTTFAPSFTNAGNVNLNTGTVTFTGGYTQSGGVTSLAGGTFASTTAAIFNGGTLTGAGVFNAPLTNNNAFIKPGGINSPGLITVGGALTLNGGTLDMELAGTTPGSGYDQLKATGAASLGGTLNVTLIGGFTPANGNIFDVVKFASSTGNFDAQNLPTFGIGGSFSAVTNPTEHRLTALVAVADLAVTQTVSPASPIVGSNVTFTITVANNGAAGAASVALSNTFSGGTFVSVATTAGSCLGSGPVNCTLGNIAGGSNAVITLVLNAPSTGTISNTASATTTSPESTTTNNSSVASATVGGLNADLVLTKTGPSTARVNTRFNYTITVTNNGPSDANDVVVNDMTPARLDFVSNSGACTTAYPCSLGTIPAGESRVITSRYELTSGGLVIVNTATVTSSTADPVTANNSDSETTTPNCSTSAPTDLTPAHGTTNAGASGMLRWVHLNATDYRVFLGRVGSGCSATTPYKIVTTDFVEYSGLEEGVEYEWKVEARTTGCPIATSVCQRFTVGRSCSTTAPSLVAPANGSNVNSPVRFSWTATGVAGTTYQVFAAVNGGSSIARNTPTTATFIDASIGDGSVTWFVVATPPNCPPVQSANGTFNVCNTPAAPIVSVIGQATSGQTYRVEWNETEGAIYELQEAANAAFTEGVRTFPTNTTFAPFRNLATDAPLARYYRVRMKTPCSPSFGPYSTTVRIVIVPLPPKTQPNPNLNVPAGSTEVVVQEVFIPGEPGAGLQTFVAEVDKPWLAVRPQSGILPPDGVTLQVLADPAHLPNGTFTGTVIVTITSGSGARARTNDTKKKNVPVSVSLVTPVTPGTPQTPPDNALIIPSVGHLGGLNSQWQSDIRVTNTSTEPLRYQLTFSQAGSSETKQTEIEVGANETTALDDIVKNWYGLGSLSDGANGILEVRPVGGTGGDDTPSASSRVTVVSSRTYNATANGTLGQYIPAIPFSSFVGRANADGLQQVLSLQQIAQNSAYRTNVGVVEASGHAASVNLSVFSSAGSKLLDLPMELAAGEQKQMNALLASHGINDLKDGRIEVRVTGGDGRVTAYASVVDSQTNDPLLVTGVPIGLAGASRFVLPGVAAINSASANWRTDMRVFNAGSGAQNATLTFFPQNDGPSRTANVTLNPGEVRTLDNVLPSVFGVEDNSGTVHVTTGNNSALVVTGRTYNQTPTGTFGQFVPAVTSADAVGTGERSLHIQQVEDSPRYRTNLGLAEVNGREAKVEVSVILPDSRLTPKIELTLPANSFRQLPLLRELGLGNVYNARIVVKVLEGEGRIAAYGSIIDMNTQDPTYVPAQ